MKKFLVIVSLSCLLGLYVSCSNEEINIISEVENQKSLKERVSSITPRIIVFGRYNPKCEGKNCVEVYLFNGENLLEDVSNKIPAGFNAIDVKNFIHNVEYDTRLDLFLLFDELPVFELKSIKGTVIGNPGINDQPVYYLEYYDRENAKIWVVDSNLNSVPKYLSDYICLRDNIIDVLEVEDITY